MATKKKATKKTGKALAKQGGAVGHWNRGNLAQAASPYPQQSFADALKAFDAAQRKVGTLRAVLAAGESTEVTAHRCQRLANLASELSMAAHSLNAAAYAEADK